MRTPSSKQLRRAATSIICTADLRFARAYMCDHSAAVMSAPPPPITTSHTIAMLFENLFPFIFLLGILGGATTAPSTDQHAVAGMGFIDPAKGGGSSLAYCRSSITACLCTRF